MLLLLILSEIHSLFHLPGDFSHEGSTQRWGFNNLLYLDRINIYYGVFFLDFYNVASFVCVIFLHHLISFSILSISYLSSSSSYIFFLSFSYSFKFQLPFFFLIFLLFCNPCAIYILSPPILFFLVTWSATNSFLLI